MSEWADTLCRIYSLSDNHKEKDTSNEIDYSFILTELIRLTTEDSWPLVEESLNEILAFINTSQGKSPLNPAFPHRRKQRIWGSTRRIMKKKSIPSRELSDGLDATYMNILYSVLGPSMQYRDKTHVCSKLVEEFISKKTMSIFTIIDVLHLCSVNQGNYYTGKFSVSVGAVDGDEVIKLLGQWGVFSIGVPPPKNLRNDRECIIMTHSQKGDDQMGEIYRIPDENSGNLKLKQSLRKRNSPKVTIEMKKSFLNQFEEFCTTNPGHPRDKYIESLYMSTGNISIAKKIIDSSFNLEELDPSIRSKVFTPTEDSELLEDKRAYTGSFPKIKRPQEVINDRIIFLTCRSQKCSSRPINLPLLSSGTVANSAVYYGLKAHTSPNHNIHADNRS